MSGPGNSTRSSPAVRLLSARPRFRFAGWALSIGLALAVIGFAAAAQWKGSEARQDYTSSAQQVLAAQVVGLEGEQKTLRDQLAAAERQVQSFQSASAGSQSAQAQLNQQLASARLAAGLTKVSGPGVIIEISDSSRPVPAGENPANYIVLVDDLHDIVTALWASGAEAITINGERLVSTSSIYGVGSSILVNTAFLSPTFRLEAIGPNGLLDRFLANPAWLSSRVAHRIDAFGLEFATQQAGSLTLPAFSGQTAVVGQGLILRVNGELDPIAVNDLINELRNAGAEAIAVDQVRITARSVCVLGAGTLEIDGTRVDRAFTIRAVGDPDGLLTALQRPGGIISQLKLFVNATIDATQSQNVEIPATRQDLEPKVAKTVP